MKIIEKGSSIIVKELQHFNLEQTLECGQCFRFTKLEDSKYILIAKSEFLMIEQKEDELIFYDTSIHKFKEFWMDYFDLNNDYDEIKNYIISKDPFMKEIIDHGYGIRILNQDFFEMLISFIISQNKQIPQIKQVLNNLCMKYGEKIKEYNGETYYGFPTIETLSKLEEEDFRLLKAGFRAKYLVDACEKVSTGLIKESELIKLSSKEILEELCTIKGVGVKVSNCVLLFGLSRREAFPIDVWIKRILEEIYFKEETKLEVMQKFAEDKFSSFGGYAQQYLFYYSRK